MSERSAAWSRAMRFPRPRITLWLLMVIVALTAALTGAWVLRQRAREYKKRADQYAQMEQQQLTMAKLIEGFVARDIKFIEQQEEHLEEQRAFLKRESALVGRM